MQVRKRGKYELADIANMDQTGSSFVTDVGKTYETTNSKDVWCKSGQSGLDKGQCTVQLAVFTDGISHAIPLLIFRGQGLCIKTMKGSSGIKELLFNFQRMLGVMKELWLLGYRMTGAAINQWQVPMASYLFQIFTEANRHLR